ncbi:high mobility group box domain-containing protein [Mycena albidolilacea]|uniref:High mobility group box domain-containing protein n=1 Tax=Mycena albidolilacea TaxID=1033008 RepID=A0AAD7AC25_9AGAR|nr:high mobility group box domain-containing protein [Mycena albidolilacea]
MKLFVTALFLPLVMASTVPAGSDSVQSTFGTPCTPKDAALMAPRRAMSAYMFFSREWRDAVRAENPDAPFGEIGKLIGVKWKELDDEGRKPYMELATKDKTRAEEEKRVYELQKSASVCDDE